MHRIVVGGPFAAGRELIVPEEEGHHLRVRRARSGEPVQALDGQGGVAVGTLVMRGREWLVDVERVSSVPRPPRLVLLVGAGDRDRFAWLVEKSVELGVTDLVPLETERSAQVATRFRDGQRDRLARRAQDALKQSGGTWALNLHDTIPVAAAVESFDLAIRWLADPAGRVAAGLAPDAEVAIAVGPEGGFTEAERNRVTAAGFEPVRLGPRILRFETAAVAAVAIAGAARKEPHD